ncbi:MAG TPA: hypothetical protein VE267_17830 [Bradyrhizobium sp.]|nr:hypothetical protein [Bradyrhizobium sp.]
MDCFALLAMTWLEVSALPGGVIFSANVAFPLGPKTLYGAVRSAIVELDNLLLSKAWLKAKAFGG